MSVVSSAAGMYVSPKRSECKVEFQGSNTAVICVDPLNRGFGVTIGNALRRILLSSIPGAAVVAVKIEGVDHEFSSIPGVIEDVFEIILNIKNLAITYQGDTRKKIKLSASNIGPVTASAIKTSDDIKIINKDLVICNIGSKTNLEIEMYVAPGRGYVTGEENRVPDMAIGVIPIDAIFCPVQSVSFKVEKSRVGSHTEFDRLYLVVKTNGTIPPDHAVNMAAHIMQEQMQIFINPSEISEKDDELEQKLPFDPKLLTKVQDLELSVRATNCLKNANVVYLGDLIQKTQTELMHTPNFGKKSLGEIQALVEAMGFKLGTVIKDWPPENLEELAQKYGDHIS